jgi:hypothetical protein
MSSPDAFMDWWKQVNDLLEDCGSFDIRWGQAHSWHAEGLTPAEAVQRQLDNLESSQEERSYYDA